MIEAIEPEVWQIHLINGVEINIGWQRAKYRLNRTRHNGVSLADGIPTLDDPNNSVTIQYENGEERERYKGLGANGKVLLVVVQWLEDTGEEIPSIRIISVRELNSGDQNMDEDIKPNKEKHIDPDNPPLTGKEVWRPGAEQIKQRVVNHKRRVQNSKN
jgi:uncharacterized DUF497 family protein